MQGLVLAALLSFSPPDAPEAPISVGSPGSLEVRAGPGEQLRVVDGGGAEVAAVTGRAPDGDPVRLDLPPGSYRVLDAEGATVGEIVVSPGATTSLETYAAASWRPPPRVVPASEPSPPAPSQPAVTPIPTEELERRRKRRAKMIGAPIASAFVPGLGQFINRKWAKGAGFLVGAAALTGSTALLGEIGSTRADGTRRPIGVEYARLGTLGILSSGLGVLWVSAILDAYADAAGKEPRGKADYKVQVQAARFVSAGAAPVGRAALYQSFNLSFLGQPAPGLSVGVSDLSAAYDNRYRRSIFEGGVRLGYTFYHLRRVWLGGSGGAVVQGSVGPESTPPLDSSVDPRVESDVAVTPYLQMDGRFFLLDRWSIDVMPRVSMPVAGTRHFTGGKSIPTFATTFELGTALSVEF